MCKFAAAAFTTVTKYVYFWKFMTSISDAEEVYNNKTYIMHFEALQVNLFLLCPQ